ncbi:MAG: Succinate dehydrogenase/fumarate reductase iron-sulfur subunit [Promethearchaeota archaeon]|nr:MAG: Succinate dehydrogenase/fumarate reductase iron-sulfur subunit [Candidatus Lokiarchaeota archaeon]
MKEEIKPIDISFFAPFDEDGCKQCGECLINCPIIDLTRDESIKEMERLIKGQPTKKVLQECQSCFTCNFYCQGNVRPASLILKRWNEQYKEKGLKRRAKYFITHYPQYPNFRSYVMEHLPKETEELVAEWASLEPLKGDTLTYPGCNIITYAELTQASFFKDLDIRGRLEYCCGETLFRTGYKEQLHQVTKRLDKWFNQLQPKNLLVLCSAGTNVFINVLPHYGLTYKFQSIKSYIQYLWEKLQTGEIKIKKKLDMTVTIQESCYAKMFGDEYMDLPRKILNAIGIEVIEIEACREDMRCCGIGGGFSVASSYNPFNIMSASFQNLKEFKKSGADAICVYCAGCLATLLTAQKLFIGKKMKIYHIIELLEQATGEKPSLSEKTKIKRAHHFFWGIIKKQFPKVFSRKRFKIAEIPEEPPEYKNAW